MATTGTGIGSFIWRGGGQVLGSIQHCRTFWRSRGEECLAAIRNGNENVSARRRQAKRDHDGGRTRLGVGHGIGTDVARTSADIILIARDLPKFVETLRVARRFQGIVILLGNAPGRQHRIILAALWLESGDGRLHSRRL